MSENKKSQKRKRWTAKAKMEIVLEGLKGQETVAELCRRFGISQSMYYEWKDIFLNHGLEGLKHGGKSAREKELENQLREAQRALGKAALEIEILKKTRNYDSKRGGRTSRAKW